MAGEDEISRVFADIHDPSEMRRFFEEIFTPAERKDFVLRWELMKMLFGGMSQRQVASSLGISLCKITRGAKVLKGDRSVTRRILESKVPLKVSVADFGVVPSSHDP